MTTDLPLPAPSRPVRILVIEDVEADFRLLQRHLAHSDLDVQCTLAAHAEALDGALAQTGWDVVLTDHRLPDLPFDRLMAQLAASLPGVPVILTSGAIREEEAVELLRSGVAEFVFKDRLARLAPAIRRCLDDVRRRREAEEAAQALRDSEQLNRAIVESMADGLFIVQDGLCVHHNPALARMMGYPASAEQTGDCDLGRLVAAESQADWHRLMQVTTHDECDLVFMHRDGQRLDMALRATPFSYRGRPALLGLLRDVTAERRAHAELQDHRLRLEELVTERTARAEAANRAKSSFLANMSHEIRTPINAITGKVHLLQRASVTAVQREHLGVIDKAAHHLLALVNDVLDLSKIESGHLVLEQLDFELDRVVERACSLLAGRAQERGLELVVDNRAAGLRLRGDPTRVQQLLLNLLSNAVKFTTQGRIDVRVCATPVAAPAGGGGPPRLAVTLAVEDTGIGIPADRVERLFRPFEQADSAVTRQYGGTGLGLAICRHLAELMGGGITVDTRAGHGSCFTVQLCLPAAAPPTAGEPVPPLGVDALEALLRDRHAGRRVLVVDDNAVNQLVAQELLVATGLVVDVASSGRAAVDAAANGEFDAILMDVQMPGLDGMEATRLLRALPALARTPIIAMTANAMSEDRDACLAAGMSDHLAKPVEPAVLYALVLRWLDRSTASNADRRSATPTVAFAPAPVPAAVPAPVTPAGPAASSTPPPQGLALASTCIKLQQAS